MAFTFEQIAQFNGHDVAEDQFNCSVQLGDYLYIGGQSFLWIVDVSTPTDPIIISHTNDMVEGDLGCVGLAISEDGNTLYVASNTANRLFAENVTNKVTPVYISDISLEGDLFAMWGGDTQTVLMTDDNALALHVNTDEEGYKGEVWFANISNPAEMSFYEGVIGDSYDDPNDSIWQISNNLDLQLAVGVENSVDSNARVEIWGVENPDSPSLLVTGEQRDDIDNFEGLAYRLDNDSDSIFGVLQDSDDATHKIIVWDVETGDIVNTITTEASIENEIRQIAFASGDEADFLAIVDFNGDEENNGTTTIFDVTNRLEITEIDSKEPGASNVSFTYPFLFTPGPTTGTSIWEIFNVPTVLGWVYGDNNVIYQGESA